MSKENKRFAIYMRFNRLYDPAVGGNESRKFDKETMENDRKRARIKLLARIESAQNKNPL